MSKILLGISALLIAASAVFGFLAKGKITDLKGNITTLETNLDSEKKARNEAETQRKEAEQQFAAEKVRADAAVADANAAKADLSKAQAQVTDLQGQLTARNAEVERLTQEVAKASGAVPGQAPPDQQRLTELETQLREAQAKLSEAEQVNKTLMARADDAENKARALQEQENKRQGKLLAKGLEGQILAVNQGWNFVVLGIGDRQGVVPNAEMIIVRGNQAIGRVRVTSVEPSTSIADIVPNSLARGVRVQPGDRVIYPGA